MFHNQGASRQNCSLLAVVCGKTTEYDQKPDVKDGKPRYCFPEIVSSGRLEVQLLKNPSTDEFRKVLDSWQPNIVYLQGERLSNDEVGSLIWGGVDMSSVEAISGLFSATLPTAVYLELPNGENLAEAFHAKGVPYVMYWKSAFSCYAASHFRQAFLCVAQSSTCHVWDAFQLAHASFRLYCVRNNLIVPEMSQMASGKLVPHLLGDPPKINVPPPEAGPEDDEESNSDTLPAIKIYDDDVNMRFLICGTPCSLDECLLGSIADGLNALLNIEMRGSKLHNRVSALPPPLQAGAFSRGVVTMRCDLSTSSSAHISLLVSGSAQTCFDDLLLENHIKSEIIGNSELVHALPSDEENRPPTSEPRRSMSVACGSEVFEVCMKVPTWASQILRQLAPDVSYRSLVALGIASIQGLAVASFEKDDAERLLFFCTKQGKEDGFSYNFKIGNPPSWLRPPAPSRKRPNVYQETSAIWRNGLASGNHVAVKEEIESRLGNGFATPLVTARQKLKVAAMRPIPHVRHQKMLPFSGISAVESLDGNQVKTNLPIIPSSAKGSSVGVIPVAHRKSAPTYSPQIPYFLLSPIRVFENLENQSQQNFTRPPRCAVPCRPHSTELNAALYTLKREEMEHQENEYEEHEHEVYGGDIPDEEGEMDAEYDETSAAAESEDDPNAKELENMKKRLKEIEDEAGALREMQAKVEKEMGSAQGFTHLNITIL